MEKALNEDRENTLNFYTLLFTAQLFGVNRYSPGLKSTITYPSENFPLLAIKDEDKIVVPLFTSENHMSTWSSAPSDSYKLSFKNILQLIPDDWWICLNLSSEVEKEFSPWEISKLKTGEEAINEVIEELLLGTESGSSTVKPIDRGQYTDLEKTIDDLIRKDDGIQIVTLLLEETFDLEEKIEEKILMAVKVDKNSQKTIKYYEDLIDTQCKLALIGTIGLKVFIYTNEKDFPLYGVFAGIEPLYKRKGSFRRFLKKIFI